MWIIWSILGISIPVLIAGLYGWWNNRQVDKYNEWLEQQKSLENSPEST
jgi:hypothetical protein